jgi:hypothetical protein
MRREAEEASTPEYQALITVRSNPKARIAMAMPKMVRPVRSLFRKVFLKRILRMSIIEKPFI